MFARVVSVDKVANRRTSAVLETAPIDEVFENVNYSFDGPVTPRLVDENGNPLPGSRAPSGELVMRLSRSPWNFVVAIG
jgi:hypothetical protein